jgi:hypothetical protein
MVLFRQPNYYHYYYMHLVTLQFYVVIFDGRNQRSGWSSLVVIQVLASITVCCVQSSVLLCQEFFALVACLGKWLLLLHLVIAWTLQVTVTF